MIKRYHKRIYFPKESQLKLKKFTENLNSKTWKYSSHAIDNLKHRSYNLKEILKFIKNLLLKSQNIFEFYIDNDKIIKAVYRINYNEKFALCLVISHDKTLITIYINSLDDEHITLKKALYNK